MERYSYHRVGMISIISCLRGAKKVAGGKGGSNH